MNNQSVGRMLFSICVGMQMLSCSIAHSNVSADTKKRPYEVDLDKLQRAIKFRKGYKVALLTGGHSEKEEQVVYSDSSALYLTTFPFSSLLNYNNIISLGPAVSEKRFRSRELDAAVSEQLHTPQKPDTVTLQGQDRQGRFWKDIRLERVTVGYAKIPKARKQEFDKYLIEILAHERAMQ